MASSDKIELFKTILPLIDGASSYIDDFVDALKNSDPETVRHIAVASRIVEYKKSYDDLIKLIENSNSTEHNLQKHLENNSWMFGSEYSESFR